MIHVFVFALLFGFISARSSPDYIQKCADPTPECLKKAIQDAIPEFTKGIPALEVDSLDPFNHDIAGLEPLPGFKFQLNNGRFTGLRNCIVDAAKFEKNILDLKVHCNITVKGKYKATGKILIVTLNGDGDAKIKANNVIIHAKVNFEDKQKDGVDYKVIKDYTIKHKFGDRVSFGLTNIFKGNPELSNAVLAFLNENWKDVADEIGGPVIDHAVKAVINIVRKFFYGVPKNELF